MYAQRFSIKAMSQKEEEAILAKAHTNVVLHRMGLARALQVAHHEVITDAQRWVSEGYWYMSKGRVVYGKLKALINRPVLQTDEFPVVEVDHTEAFLKHCGASETTPAQPVVVQTKSFSIEDLARQDASRYVSVFTAEVQAGLLAAQAEIQATFAVELTKLKEEKERLRHEVNFLHNAKVKTSVEVKAQDVAPATKKLVALLIGAKADWKAQLEAEFQGWVFEAQPKAHYSAAVLKTKHRGANETFGVGGFPEGVLQVLKAKGTEHLHSVATMAGIRAILNAYTL